MPTNILSGGEDAKKLHLGLARRPNNTIDDYHLRDILRFFHQAS
ncbi:MAG: hypothetical protein AAFR46_14930 [Pseudomonadota bacterium]